MLVWRQALAGIQGRVEGLYMSTGAEVEEMDVVVMLEKTAERLERMVMRGN